MQFNFQSVIDGLNAGLPFGDNFAFKNSRTSVVPGEYMFNTILPQEDHPTYNVSGGSMRIYPTMSQAMPMDTPPKPIGAMESSTFNENTTKWGGMMHFPEGNLRALQEFATNLRSVGITDGLSIGAIADLEAKRLTQTLLGFSDLLLKSQWDNYEWQRSQALTVGQLSIQNSGIDVTVDYDIPASHKITRSGASSYYNTSSKFWEDIRTAFRTLNNITIIMNSNTYYSIIDNTVNAIRVADSVGTTRSITKIVGAIESTSTDARDRLTIVLYDKSGSVITPKGTLKAVPFMADGKILILGEQQPDGFELLQGSTPDPANTLRLGYTHIAPTVEGGRTGIWSRIFTPEGKPYQLLGETVTNGLPVIINPNKLMILTTAMPA